MELTLAALQSEVNMNSLPPFAAIEHPHQTESLLFRDGN